MIIERKKFNKGQRVIDLAGPEGNAFCLVGIARSWGRQMHLDIDEIAEDMMSKDYAHLLQVFERHFGSIVTLVKP